MPLDDEPGCWYDNAYLIYDHRDCQIAPRGKKPSFAREIFEICQKSTSELFLIDDELCFVFYVYAYIHGGVKLYLNEHAARRYEPTGFDTSMKGFVVVKQCEETPDSDSAFKKAHEIIDNYNIMLAGEIYRYHSEFGSCGGFWGSEGYKQMIEEAKQEIDYEMNRKNEERFNLLKRYIKSKVPIIIS